MACHCNVFRQGFECLLESMASSPVSSSPNCLSMMACKFLTIGLGERSWSAILSQSFMKASTISATERSTLASSHRARTLNFWSKPLACGEFGSKSTNWVGCGPQRYCVDENWGWDKSCGLTIAGWLDNKCNFEGLIVPHVFLQDSWGFLPNPRTEYWLMCQPNFPVLWGYIPEDWSESWGFPDRTSPGMDRNLMNHMTLDIRTCAFISCDAMW